MLQQNFKVKPIQHKELKYLGMMLPDPGRANPETEEVCGVSRTSIAKLITWPFDGL